MSIYEGNGTIEVDLVFFTAASILFVHFFKCFSFLYMYESCAYMSTYVHTYIYILLLCICIYLCKHIYMLV